MLTFYEDSKESKSIICRRGLKKFFDIYLEFVDDSVQGTWVETNQIQNKLKALTLKDVLSNLDHGVTIF